MGGLGHMIWRDRGSRKTSQRTCPWTSPEWSEGGAKWTLEGGHSRESPSKRPKAEMSQMGRNTEDPPSGFSPSSPRLKSNAHPGPEASSPCSGRPRFFPALSRSQTSQRGPTPKTFIARGSRLNKPPLSTHRQEVLDSRSFNAAFPLLTNQGEVLARLLLSEGGAPPPPTPMLSQKSSKCAR